MGKVQLFARSVQFLGVRPEGVPPDTPSDLPKRRVAFTAVEERASKTAHNPEFLALFVSRFGTPDASQPIPRLLRHQPRARASPDRTRLPAVGSEGHRDTTLGHYRCAIRLRNSTSEMKRHAPAASAMMMTPSTSNASWSAYSRSLLESAKPSGAYLGSDR